MPAFPVLTTQGDLLTVGIAGIETRLPGNTSEDRKFLLSVGDGESASAPEWDAIEIADVDGLLDALDGKAASAHTHTISNITGLQTAIDGKASLSGAQFSGKIGIGVAPDATAGLHIESSSGIGFAKFRNTTTGSAYFELGNSVQSTLFGSGGGTVPTFQAQTPTAGTTFIYASADNLAGLRVRGAARIGWSGNSSNAATSPTSGPYFSSPSSSEITANASIFQATGVIRIGSFTVGTLPTAGISANTKAFASNGRKAGEGSGSGTGVPVWYDGTKWLTYYDNTEVQA